jgi:RNA polymerase sigma-70 factor, ECF subfamily
VTPDGESAPCPALTTPPAQKFPRPRESAETHRRSSRLRRGVRSVSSGGTGLDKRAEFERTALPCARALYGTALRLTHRPEDASDLVQETFLRAYRTFDNFAVGTNAKAWLFTIMYSIFINRRRRERREPLHVPVHELEERELTGSRLEAAPEAGIPGEPLTSEAVDRALRQLPEAFRSALPLVDVEELSYEEAAGVLACPLGTLRSRLCRARKLLFAELREYASRLHYTRRS